MDKSLAMSTFEEYEIGNPYAQDSNDTIVGKLVWDRLQYPVIQSHELKDYTKKGKILLCYSKLAARKQQHFLKGHIPETAMEKGVESIRFMQSNVIMKNQDELILKDVVDILTEPHPRSKLTYNEDLRESRKREFRQEMNKKEE